jgi:hypothetical protein
MATFELRARRVVFAAGFAMAIAVAPAVAVVAAPTTVPAPRPVADGCPGSITIGIAAIGAPTTPDCGTLAPPAATGGAPSQAALTACANRPGCLSNYFYGPGNVQVPNVDTTVHQSQ